MSAVPSPVGPMSTRAAPQPAVGFPTSWPTPKRLRAYRIIVWALVGLLFLFGESTLLQVRKAFKTIGKDTVPSIIAAEEIGYALADLDANVANSLLGNAQHRQAAVLAIEKQRLKVTDSIVDAAQNITYGDAEKVPIRMMMRDLGLYLERAAEARFRFDQGDAGGARASYWQATDLLHKNLLVEAANLDAANKRELDVAYWNGGKETQGAELLVLLLGGGVIVALLVLQGFLFKRMRRVLNLPLVAATVLAVAFPGYLAYRFTTARESLRVAKEDAFDSIHSLVRARALAYDANGDESRYLLEPADTRSYERAFQDKVLLLTSSPTHAAPTRTEIDTRKRTRTAGGKTKETGLFWDELDNITFPGEYAAAARMVQAFRDYMLIDARVRKLAVAGKMQDAVELCIGDKPDESNAAFDRFDAGLASTLEINRAAFDHEMDETRKNLGTAETLSILFALLVSALTWIGVRPRLREYTA